MAVRQLLTSRFVTRADSRRAAVRQVIRMTSSTSQYAPRFPKRPDPEDNVFNEAKFAERAPGLTDAEKMKEKDRTISPARYLALAATVILGFGAVYMRKYTSYFAPPIAPNKEVNTEQR